MLLQYLKGVQKAQHTYFLFTKRQVPLRDILQAPLNRRGWVLQELILSPRTLHFCKDQVYWHCKELATSADGAFVNEKGRMSNLGWYYGPDVVLEQSKPSKPSKALQDYQVRRWYSRPSATEKDTTSMNWWHLVEDYSGRKLTHLSDKLVALAGVASLFAGIKGDEFVAGIWRKDLPESLLWYNEDWYREQNVNNPTIVSGMPTWVVGIHRPSRSHATDVSDWSNDIPCSYR